MTAETVLDTAQGILKLDRDNIGIAGLESAALLRVVDRANSSWIEAHKKGGGEPPEYMQQDGGGTFVSSTNVNDSTGVQTTGITTGVQTTGVSTTGEQTTLHVFSPANTVPIQYFCAFFMLLMVVLL